MDQIIVGASNQVHAFTELQRRFAMRKKVRAPFSSGGYRLLPFFALYGACTLTLYYKHHCLPILISVWSSITETTPHIYTIMANVFIFRDISFIQVGIRKLGTVRFLDLLTWV